jgi:hypothetical protein
VAASVYCFPAQRLISVQRLICIENGDSLYKSRPTCIDIAPDLYGHIRLPRMPAIGSTEKAPGAGLVRQAKGLAKLRTKIER